MRALRRGMVWLLVCVVLLVAGAGLLLWTALEPAALVPRTAPASVLDLVRAMRLLRQIDPRQWPGDGPREAAFNQRELELLIDQGAQRTAVPLATRVGLQAGQARVQASVSLAELMASAPGLLPPWLGTALAGHWVNVELQLRETPGLPAIERLQVGRLPVPALLAERLLRHQLEQQFGPEQLRLAGEMVKAVRFAPDQLQVSYLWRPGDLRRMLATMVPQPDQDRLRLYLAHLASLKPKSVAGGRIPMLQLMRPAFALARQRTAAGADAAQENRSAILALAFASFPRELIKVLPAARRWRLPTPWALALAGREDFALHYLISAALAAEAGGPFADAVGVFKEVLDARGASGFSFNDLAADRAGTRFGLLARRAPALVQTRLAAELKDEDLLPDIRDLPESLSPAAFTERYGAIGSPAYQRLLADIELRLDRLPLYR